MDSERLVETYVTDKPVKSASTGTASTDHCRCNHVAKGDTSVSNIEVRRKAGSYLMASKGLLKDVKNKVNQLDHFIQLT